MELDTRSSAPPPPPPPPPQLKNECSLSDHYPTCVVFKESFGRKYSHTTIKYRCYKNFNEEAFCKDLSQIPWDTIDIFDYVDNALEAWYNLFLDMIDKHLPLREKRVKKQQQPDWMTYEIIQCMAQRDHFKSINDMVNYKTYRNCCVSLIRDAKTTYYKTCVEDHKDDSNKLWQYLRDIILTNLKTAPPSLRNNSNNSSISDPEDMCEHFNNFNFLHHYIAV
jgi:hypothetical protein